MPAGHIGQRNVLAAHQPPESVHRRRRLGLGAIRDQGPVEIGAQQTMASCSGASILVRIRNW